MKKFSYIFLLITIVFGFGILLVPNDPSFTFNSFLDLFKGSEKDKFINRCNGFAKRIVEQYPLDMEGNKAKIDATLASYPYVYDGVLVIYQSYGVYEYSLDEADFSSIHMYAAIEKEDKTTYLYAVNASEPNESQYMILKHIYNSDNKKYRPGVVNNDVLQVYDKHDYENKMSDVIKVCQDIKTTTNRAFVCIKPNGELIE